MRLQGFCNSKHIRNDDDDDTKTSDIQKYPFIKVAGLKIAHIDVPQRKNRNWCEAYHPQSRQV